MIAASEASTPLVLFVTGDAPRSRRARDNLARGLRAAGCRADVVHEVDLIQAPSRAVQEGIFATPALLRRGDDGEPAVLYGDLSNDEQLRRFLADMASGDAPG